MPVKFYPPYPVTTIFRLLLYPGSSDVVISADGFRFGFPGAEEGYQFRLVSYNILAQVWLSSAISYGLVQVYGYCNSDGLVDWTPERKGINLNGG
jgi:hypothetical protein